MGKKHIIETSQEDLIKEKEKVDSTINKEVRVKVSRRIFVGRVYISSSYNNTIITLTDDKGQVLASKSAGAVGFKGTKKSTSFAASRVSETIANVCKKLAMEKIEVLIKDVTPIPHNGCRPKKVRRV